MPACSGIHRARRSARGWSLSFYHAACLILLLGRSAWGTGQYENEDSRWDQSPQGATTMAEHDQRRPAAQKKTSSPRLGPLSGAVDATSVPRSQILKAKGHLQAHLHPLVVPANLLAIQPIEGAWTAVSASLCTFAGRPAADLLGWQDLLHPAERDQVAAAWKNTAAKAQGYEVVCRLRRFDGHYHRWRLHVVSLRGDTGRVQAWVCLGTDESERRHAKQAYAQFLAREQHIRAKAAQTTRAEAAKRASELEALLAQVATLVIERERLRAQVATLEETTRRMDEFLARASHELRTPLTVIKGLLQWLVKEESHPLDHLTPSSATLAPDQLSSAKMPPLPRLLRQVEHLERLITVLLDTARMRVNKLELRQARVDLFDLVQEEVEQQRVLEPQRTIAVSRRPPRSLLVEVDRDRIGQVVTNYLTNALKYSPPDCSIEVGVEREGEQARVWIRDQGPGIPLVEQERIWERFYRIQGRDVSDSSGGNLGLGLYICRTLIEGHGGDTGVTSTPGAGATFWFTLPLVRKEASEQTKSSQDKAR